jgi:hypothetical protein
MGVKSLVAAAAAVSLVGAHVAGFTPDWLKEKVDGPNTHEANGGVCMVPLEAFDEEGKLTGPIEPHC